MTVTTATESKMVTIWIRQVQVRKEEILIKATIALINNSLHCQLLTLHPQPYLQKLPNTEENLVKKKLLSSAVAIIIIIINFIFVRFE